MLLVEKPLESAKHKLALASEIRTIHADSGTKIEVF